MNQQGFNPKARWDRNIPETDTDNPETDNLNEPITVLALFKSGKITPKKFSWRNKIYPADNIAYYWQERTGLEIINYFSVKSGENLYQISFNNTSLAWKINKILT